jgi:hypothetical protein
MWVFLSSRLRAWLLLAIALPLPGCLFSVSPWPLTAGTRQPARQDCLTRPALQWLRYPGASRAGPGADRAADGQRAGSSLSAPAPAPASGPGGPARGSKTSSATTHRRTPVN